MTISATHLRARRILGLAWEIAMQVAARGHWTAFDEAGVDGIAMAWRECVGAMGIC